MAVLERFRHPRWPLLLLGFFAWCLVPSVLQGPGSLAVGELDYINMDDYLANVDSEQHLAAGREEQKVRKQFGLADTTATLGKLFRYHIPADAFLGDIDHYEVKEVTSGSLPKWLYFSDATATLEGLPTAQDVGQFYVAVIAVGKHSSGDELNSDQDVFTIKVLSASRKFEESHWLKDGSSSALLRCDSTTDVAVLTITLDGDLNYMDAASRVQLVNRAMKHFALSIEQLRLMPVEDDDLLFDGNNVLSGHGNALEKHSSGLLLQWPVGCYHEDSSAFKTVVGSLEKSSSDGTLADVLGLPVIGWYLATVKPFSSRQKRQQPNFENLTTTDSAPMRDPEILENLPEIPVLGIEKTSPLPEGLILPTLASSALNLAATSSFLSEKPSLTAASTSQDFAGIPVLSTFMPSLIEPISLEHEPSTQLLLQSSMVQPSIPRTETVSLPDVTSCQPTGTTVTMGDTLTIIATATTQLPQSLHPTTRAPDYKLEIDAGQISRFPVPQEYFAAIDYNAWAVRLALTNADGMALPDNTWIQIDSSKREIYALPLVADVGVWHFLLWVSDIFSQNASSQHLIELTVREDPRSPGVHHEFVMLMRYDVHRYRFAVDWQLKLIRKLVAFFGDRDESSVLVQSVGDEPLAFAWTNTSLPARPCPREAIDWLLGRMAYKGEGISTLPLRKVMSPEFRVHKVTIKLVGECEPQPEPEPNFTAGPHVHLKPQVRNHIDLINATEGRMLRFVVPADTFFDEEDGSTRNLSLRFLTITGLDVPENSWIQFLASHQEFRGLPMATDVGSVQYQLVAANRRNTSVADAFIITVVKPPGSKPPSVEFSLRIDADFHDFDRRPNNKYSVLYKLARLYGDPDPRYITVRAVASGSVVFIWTNNTLPSEPCPAASIHRLVQVMFNPDGTVSEKLLSAFSGGYPITGAEVIPGGECLADVTPTKVSIGPSSTVKTDHAYTDDDVYISTIVPAVVIAGMLVVAALVACALYRNKRKGKVTVDEDSPFVSKGIPIIFAEELEDGNASARTSKEEKPLLPPPKYPQSSSSGASSHPAEPEHGSASEGEEEEAENSPRYQPPPPLTSNVDTSVNRPKHTPNYRLPPPYVPP